MTTNMNEKNDHGVSHGTASTFETSPADDEIAKQVYADVDVVHVTTKRPYREVNFIFTYIAACLGACSSFGSFVMPATSLALINESIGMLAQAKCNKHS